MKMKKFRSVFIVLFMMAVFSTGCTVNHYYRRPPCPSDTREFTLLQVIILNMIVRIATVTNLTNIIITIGNIAGKVLYLEINH